MLLKSLQISVTISDKKEVFALCKHIYIYMIYTQNIRSKFKRTVLRES